MDTVRFGRAIGFGARQAAKTVLRAVDAARAENPSAPPPALRPASTAAAITSKSPTIPSPLTPHATAPSPAPVPPTHQRAAPPAHAASRSGRSAPRGTAVAGSVREGLNRFRDSTVEPVVRLSGVLWLEVTGVFFGIFALSTAVAAWRLRSQWRAAFTHPAAHGGLLVAAAVFALFTYFCITSFVRARRRERRRG